MAPTASHRLLKPPKSILKSSSAQASSPRTKSKSLLPSSKKDQRRIRHAQLMSKVSKSTMVSKRRRRPNKKLVTTLDTLVDALPPQEGEFSQGANSSDQPTSQVNIIKRTSSKSRPGALKRQQTEANAERERFAKNMAQMSSGKPTETAVTTTFNSPNVASTTERWTALRVFIAQTLEKRA